MKAHSWLASAPTYHNAASGDAVHTARAATPTAPPPSRALQGAAPGTPGISFGVGVASMFRRAERVITDCICRYRIQFLHLSLGLVFFWFGVLKFFPGLSPAENLATRTIEKLTFGSIHPAVSILLLATWECAVGIALGCRFCLRATLCLLFLHMVCTFLPLLFFPGEIFTLFPFGLTLEGQYIIKNLVLMSAAMVLWPTARTQPLRQPSS